MSRIISIVFAGLLLCSVGCAQAQSSSQQVVDTAPSAGAMTIDLLLVRPLGLVATVLGTGLFVLQLPLSVVQGEPPSDPARKLIVEPARFTFRRPLGDFE
ncbi:hypothetical protein [Solimonas marina]|uniref:Multidrug transporter n=1 Tax=Solimonas marina TaxID=2714601 RepID=A0A970B702_9GAMM|nr:hypothetical protein [Solimonas marina]NKF20694.1 hypothetical protein [Solimonas marina]